MKHLKLIGVAAAAVVLSACATNKFNMNKEERAAAYDQYTQSHNLESVDRIRSFRLSGWSSLGDQHLIVNASPSRPYLVKLRNKCINLDFNQTIKFNSTNGMLQTKFDYVTVLDDIGDHCYIETIHEITKEQKKELIAIGRVVEEESEKSS